MEDMKNVFDETLEKPELLTEIQILLYKNILDKMKLANIEAGKRIDDILRKIS